jgi:hypothetical protein
VILFNFAAISAQTQQVTPAPKDSLTAITELNYQE